MIRNPHISNIDAISGALFTLRIQYEYTQTQCDEGTRDGIDIWIYNMGIIPIFHLSEAQFFKSFLDLPPSYEEVMRSKEKVLNRKLEIMRNQLETLEDYAQAGFLENLDLSLVNQSLSNRSHLKTLQRIQNQPSTSQSLPG